MMPRRKATTTISIPRELLDWIDKKVADLTFGNRSHAIEKALVELKKKMQGDDQL